MKRIVVYFHYDPQGRVEPSCQSMLAAVSECAEKTLFVENGTLTEKSRAAVESCGAQILERPNTGLDVGAYRQALETIGRDELSDYDELVMMNYTIAGPLHPLEEMFIVMEQRPELDFWGITRHYAMKSKRFHTPYGAVPTHIQSHFVAVRHKLLTSNAFWDYWKKMRLPKTYEESVGMHEARFTRHFQELGYTWDTYVNTADLANVFVNPIMACPKLLAEQRGCPVFKRRSFFSPYDEELRRTGGEATWELEHWLRQETDYPVDSLIQELLSTQSLTDMAQQMHWTVTLTPQRQSKRVQRLPAVCQVAPDCSIVWPNDAELLCAYRPIAVMDTMSYYENFHAQWLLQEEILRAAAEQFEKDPLLGVLSPAMPAFAPLYRKRLQQWHTALPSLQKLGESHQLTAPLRQDLPLPFPFAQCVVLRKAAFPQGLWPMRGPADWWLLPLVAQKNGYTSKNAESAEQRHLGKTALELEFYADADAAQAAITLGRAVKHECVR